MKITREQASWLMSHPDWTLDKPKDWESKTYLNWGLLEIDGSFRCRTTAWNGVVATKKEYGDIYVYLPRTRREQNHDDR